MRRRWETKRRRSRQTRCIVDTHSLTRSTLETTRCEPAPKYILARITLLYTSFCITCRGFPWVCACAPRRRLSVDDDGGGGGAGVSNRWMPALVVLFAGTDSGCGECDKGGGADGGGRCSRQGVIAQRMAAAVACGPSAAVVVVCHCRCRRCLVVVEVVVVVDCGLEKWQPVIA